MKVLQLIVCLFLMNIAFCQKSTTMNINGNKFTVKRYTDYYQFDSISQKQVPTEDNIELYRGDKKLLSHINYQVSNDCNSSALEVGTWEIKDTCIIFYSCFSYTGKCVGCPIGVRKQTYTVSKKGAVSLLEALVCTYWTLNDMTFMSNDKKNNFPYAIKEEHDAKHVNGTEAKALITEVKAKLNIKLLFATRSEGVKYKDVYDILDSSK